MGLFNFGKSTQPPEYYLNQHSGARLRGLVGDYGFRIRPSDYITKGTTEIQCDMRVEDIYKNHWIKSESAQPMPKKIKDHPFVSTVTVLEMATEKGDPEAPFYLAMLYQSGLGLTLYSYNNDAKAYKPDMEKAAAYLVMAKERGSVMEKAYQAIKTHVAQLGGYDLAYTEEDKIIVAMADAYFDYGHIGLKDILGGELIRFSRLGLVLLAACSNRGLPKSSIIFARHNAGYKSDPYDRSEYINEVFAAYGAALPEHCLWQYFTINNRVIQQARAKDEAAAAILKQTEINVNEILTYYARMKETL